MKSGGHREGLCQVIEWSINVPEIGHPSVSQSLNVHFVEGTALNRIHHVFADTGVLRLDRNVSSGSSNRGR